MLLNIIKNHYAVACTLMDPTNWNSPLYFALAQIMAMKIILIKSPELFLMMNTKKNKKVGVFPKQNRARSLNQWLLPLPMPVLFIYKHRSLKDFVAELVTGSLMAYFFERNTHTDLNKLILLLKSLEGYVFLMFLW